MWLQAERAGPDRAVLRLPLQGCGHIQQAGQSLSLGTGVLMFDHANDSLYSVRTERMALMVVAMDPGALALAAARLAGREDPEPWLAHLPQQCVVGDGEPEVRLLRAQILKILAIADRCGPALAGRSSASAVMAARLEDLLLRAVAMLVFPKLREAT